jgi:hypothetical protein
MTTIGLIKELQRIFLENGDIDIKLPQGITVPEVSCSWYADISYVVVETVDGEKLAMIY